MSLLLYKIQNNLHSDLDPLQGYWINMKLLLQYIIYIDTVLV